MAGAPCSSQTCRLSQSAIDDVDAAWHVWQVARDGKNTSPLPRPETPQSSGVPLPVAPWSAKICQNMSKLTKNLLT